MAWQFALSSVLASTAIMIFTYHSKLLFSSACCAFRTYCSTVAWLFALSNVLTSTTALLYLVPGMYDSHAAVSDHKAGISLNHDTILNNCADMLCFAPSSRACRKGRTHARVLTHTAVRALCVFSDIARTKRVLLHDLFIFVFCFLGTEHRFILLLVIRTFPRS